MTPATAIMLLGFGAGAFIVAGRADARQPLSPRERADALRQRVLAAQDNSARASRVARDLAQQWSAAEDDARKILK